MGIGRDSEIAPTEPSTLCRRELRFPIIADIYNFRMDRLIDYRSTVFFSAISPQKK